MPIGHFATFSPPGCRWRERRFPYLNIPFRLILRYITCDILRSCSLHDVCFIAFALSVLLFIDKTLRSFFRSQGEEHTHEDGNRFHAHAGRMLRRFIIYFLTEGILWKLIPAPWPCRVIVLITSIFPFIKCNTDQTLILVLLSNATWKSLNSNLEISPRLPSFSSGDKYLLTQILGTFSCLLFMAIYYYISLRELMMVVVIHQSCCRIILELIDHYTRPCTMFCASYP